LCNFIQIKNLPLSLTLRAQLQNGNLKDQVTPAKTRQQLNVIKGSGRQKPKSAQQQRKKEREKGGLHKLYGFV